ncbi:protein YhfH [Neobacillus sp. PS3-40]|jgi:CO dehydrogenase/acetyl-CoA synthase gamma subunit (corrinoid Fe-S protein)|nr:protein YhfH [Neobacillus sp. PS3-40]WML44023.1 protein YhfH [Neobacillus sp. PS3-40]
MLNLDFYHNLPKKECKECGCEMEEMHESYLDECVGCCGEHNK